MRTNTADAAAPIYYGAYSSREAFVAELIDDYGYFGDDTRSDDAGVDLAGLTAEIFNGTGTDILALEDGNCVHVYSRA